MVIALCERVVCVQEPVIRVISGQSISLEAKGTDTSMRISFFVSNHNFPLMYYFLRFFKSRTAHKIIGSLNVTAYTFDDSTRAFASIRVGVSSIEPIRELDYRGQIVGFGVADGCIPVNDVDFPPSREYLKLKFIIFKYVWENWGNDRLVRTREVLKEAYSDHLESLYDDLVELNIAITEANPIFVEQRHVREVRGAHQRGRRGLVQVRVPNPAVARTNFDSSHLNLSSLTDEQAPFDTSVFFELTSNATNATNAGTTNSTSTTTNTSEDAHMN